MTEGSGVRWKSFECLGCGVRRGMDVVVEDNLTRIRGTCWGECEDGSEDFPIHEYTGNEWRPMELEYQCPECGYETLDWEVPHDPAEFPSCPECSAGGPVSREAAVNAMSMINGVSASQAEWLYEAGYRSIEDIRRAEAHELAEVREIGQALAARILAHVTSDDADDLPTGRLRLKRVRLEADRDDVAHSH